MILWTTVLGVLGMMYLFLYLLVEEVTLTRQVVEEGIATSFEMSVRRMGSVCCVAA
jgi:hypothetical protein